MSDVLRKFVLVMDYVSLQLGRLARLGIFVLIGILLYEVITRYIFNRPSVWTTEMAAMVFGFYFLIGGPFTLMRDGHVRMDVIYSKWSPRTRALVDVITFPLILVYLTTFVVGGIHTVQYALRVNQHSMSQWAPPLAPIEIVTVVGGGLLLMQGLSHFIRDLYMLITGRALV